MSSASQANRRANMLFISPSRRRCNVFRPHSWNSMLGSLFSLHLLVAIALPAFGQPYYVASAGNDANPGTIGKPFASLQRAQAALRQKRGTVYLRGGTYYLPET